MVYVSSCQTLCGLQMDMGSSNCIVLTARLLSLMNIVDRLWKYQDNSNKQKVQTHTSKNKGNILVEKFKEAVEIHGTYHNKNILSER